MIVPERLQVPEFRFIKLRNGTKKALDKKWQKDNNYIYTDPSFKRYQKKANGYGILTGIKHLAIIDTDEEEFTQSVAKGLPETFTVKTPGKGAHFYCYVPGLKKKIIVENGEKHYGEVLSKNNYAVGPGSIHPNGKKYSVDKNVPIVTISQEDLMEIISPFLPDRYRKIEEIKARADERHLFDIGKIIDLSKFTTCSDGYIGPHPVHGSSTGQNLHINRNGIWYCFRHSNGGTSLQLLAIIEGVSTCEKFAISGRLTKDEYIETVNIANEKYKLDIDYKSSDFGKVIQKADLGTGQWTEITNMGYILQKSETQRGDSTKIVFKGMMKPLKKLLIEDYPPRYVVNVGHEVTGSIREILGILKSYGNVYKKDAYENSVNALLAEMNLPVERGFAAFGVYEDSDDKLGLCLDPYSLNNDRKHFNSQLEKTRNEGLTKEKIRNYIDIINYWHPWETSICMGLSIMASFSLLLRREGIFLAYPFHVSPITDIGKSKVSQIFSSKLYCVNTVTSDVLTSPFRRLNTFDLYGGPLTIDEIENIPWKTDISDFIKSSVETPISGFRGQRNLESVQYKNRIIPFFTANSFPISQPGTLKRIFRIEFDGARKDTEEYRENAPKIRKLFGKLRPIGLRIVENELQSIDNTLEELLKRIRYHSSKFYENSKTLPETRSMAYAVAYEGLRTWQHASDEHGINWQVMEYDDFLKNVVEKIESFTFESQEAPLSTFTDWFDSFSVNRGEKEKGVTWRHEEFKVEETGKTYEGLFITSSVLQTFNREIRQSGIYSLADLARSVSVHKSIPLPAEIVNTRSYFLEKQKRCVFIPDKKLKSREVDFNARRETTEF